MPTEVDDREEIGDGAPPRRRFGTVFQLGLLALNVAFWAAILGWTLLADHPHDPPDHIDDPAFAIAAERVCAGALEELAVVAPDPLAESPEARADIVDASGAVLSGMVDRLAAVPRPPGEEGEWVAQWLADWRTHLADRQAWADGLRAGRDEPFTETARAGDQISRIVDNFAEVNDMPSCATTHDV